MTDQTYTFDLYHILGLTHDVCEQSNCDELIENAYVSKVKLCHPDRHPGRKDMEELFEVVQGAYDILSDKKQRDEYNRRFNNPETTNDDCMKTFEELKKMHVVEPQKVLTPEEQKKIDAENFSRWNAESNVLNSMMGYDPRPQIPVSEKDQIKSYITLQNERSVYEKEIAPERLFEEGEQFNAAKFNALFEKFHNRDCGIIPANETPLVMDNSNIGFVFAGTGSTTNNLQYLKPFMPTAMPTKDDLQNIEESRSYSNHNKLDETYYEDLKERLIKINLETSQFDNKINGLNIQDSPYIVNKNIF
jgi:curved DNA-binding protein CbpA